MLLSATNAPYYTSSSRKRIYPIRDVQFESTWLQEATASSVFYSFCLSSIKGMCAPVSASAKPCVLSLFGALGTKAVTRSWNVRFSFLVTCLSRSPRVPVRVPVSVLRLASERKAWGALNLTVSEQAEGMVSAPAVSLPLLYQAACFALHSAMKTAVPAVATDQGKSPATPPGGWECSQRSSLGMIQLRVFRVLRKKMVKVEKRPEQNICN